jgi:hypothetical protein
MIANNEGLTAIYNRLNDPNCLGGEIEDLRSIQIAMDERILEIYGFEDIILDHAFRETQRDGIRYTICPNARSELLRRLLELNRSFAAEESSNRQAGNSTKSTTKRGRRPKYFSQVMSNDFFGGEGA